MNTSLTLWLIFAMLAVLGVTLRYLLIRRLRDDHRQVWLKNGRPALFFDTTMREQAQIMNLIWTRSLKPLNDPAIWFLVLSLRFCTVLLVIHIVFGPWLAGRR